MTPFPPDSKASSFLSRLRESVPGLDLAWSASISHDWAAELALLGDEDLLGGAVADASMASLVRCGLLTRADLFDEPHSICQSIPTSTGSYWHGILHRREPDFGNSRYWFRRVGEHPVFSELFEAVTALAKRRRSEWKGAAIDRIIEGDAWDPFLLIDLSEACYRGKRPELLEELEALQELEIDALLGYSYQAAIGKR